MKRSGWHQRTKKKEREEERRAVLVWLVTVKPDVHFRMIPLTFDAGSINWISPSPFYCVGDVVVSRAGLRPGVRSGGECSAILRAFTCTIRRTELKHALDGRVREGNRWSSGFHSLSPSNAVPCVA